MTNMPKVKILYGKGADSSWQEKSFKDDMAAIEWCRRNYEKIVMINDYRTFNQQISHFEIMDALRGIEN